MREVFLQIQRSRRAAAEERSDEGSQQRRCWPVRSTWGLGSIIVHHLRVDYRYALLRKPVALLDRERMIRGFEFYVGASALVAEMYVSLQVDRVWVRL